MPTKITTIYAWITTQADGTESLVAAHATPLISANREIATGFSDLVQTMVMQHGMPTDLVQFTIRETLIRIRKGEGLSMKRG